MEATFHLPSFDGVVLLGYLISRYSPQRETSLLKNSLVGRSNHEQHFFVGNQRVRIFLKALELKSGRDRVSLSHYVLGKDINSNVGEMSYFYTYASKLVRH